MNFSFQKEYFLGNFLSMKIALILLFIPVMAFAKIDSVFKTKTGQYISYQDLMTELPSQGFMVLGEFHNHVEIQKAQGKLVEDIVTTKKLFNKFQLGWEFLNYSKQSEITASFNRMVTNQMTVMEFLTSAVGNKNKSYVPVIQALKNKSGKLVALNIEREIKQKLIKEGRDAIYEHLPPNFEVGADAYRERFYLAMGDHVPPAMKEPYFEAQCLTDSVMSYKAVEHHNFPMTFIIAGSFHTDFYLGTVSRLKKLTSEEVVTFKIVDSSKLTANELLEIVNGDQKYGAYADYIIITSP
jgi:uncharacterized iron-regulated protein